MTSERVAPKSLTREATKKIDQYLKEVAASLIETEQDVFTVKVDGEFERVSTKLEEAITQATLKPGCICGMSRPIPPLSFRYGISAVSTIKR